ncbi:DUF6634 family protein [Afifella pfennigii]|uniref:DUF6634 family protein n=1 Tax=Afifella pfennigii TaxID=209897 RepID=UPI000690A175|nr:DUF6634 family protein [Afifella pfennigii]
MHILRLNGFGPTFGRDVERIGRLAVDLRALQEGRIPTPQDLVDAPTIDRWAIAATTGTPALVGHVFGHPMLGTREVLTSPVIVVAPNEGFARTISRYYRLGRPSEDTECFW